MKTEIDDIRIFLDTTRKTGLHPELGWKRLPMQEEEVARILETTGIDYVISDYQCPYFPIYRYDDLEAVNKVAEIVDTLHDQERLLLKAWCDRHEATATDLGEIGSAALQISKIEYLPGVKDSKALGRYLAMETDLGKRIQAIVEEKTGVTENCFDYDKLGKSYQDICDGYYVYSLDSEKEIQGYVISDSEVDRSLYSTQELKKLEIGSPKNPMLECMARTAGRYPFASSGRKIER